MRVGRAKDPRPALQPSNSEPLPEKGLCCDHPSPRSEPPRQEESGVVNIPVLALHTQLSGLVLIHKVVANRSLFLSPRQSLESV